MSQGYAVPVSPALLGTVVENETPTGPVNGSNLVFVLTNTPLAGSLKVRCDGVAMRLGVDYSLAVATITFITIAPTQWVECDYRV